MFAYPYQQAEKVILKVTNIKSIISGNSVGRRYLKQVEMYLL